MWIGERVLFLPIPFPQSKSLPPSISPGRRTNVVPFLPPKATKSFGDCTYPQYKLGDPPARAHLTTLRKAVLAYPLFLASPKVRKAKVAFGAQITLCWTGVANSH